MHAFIYTNICGNERKANIIFININYSACLARNGNISIFCPDNIIFRLENQLDKISVAVICAVVYPYDFFVRSNKSRNTVA